MRYRVFCGITAAYTVLLTYGLVVPAPLAIFGGSGMAVEEQIDYSLSGATQHVLAYAGLTGLWCAVAGGDRGQRILACGLAAGVHATGTEAAQIFVPFREFDWFDVFANAAGVACGVLAATFWIRKKFRPLVRSHRRPEADARSR